MTDAKLRTIERAEESLRALGFRVFRVRHHDDLARIEIARPEMARAARARDGRRDCPGAQDVGYKYVSLDLQGYRMGSLNEGLFLRPRELVHDRAQSAQKLFLCGLRGRSAFLVVLALIFLALHLPVPPGLARRSRLGQFRARRPPLRRRAASAASPGYPLFILIAKAVRVAVPSR